ncbi:MAG: hypothetical protein DWH94_02065 [Planctomycetota bacterium]|nr:MAG: hypothetical protein DWH94_02065 [Planctomycetota bacterium]
MPSPVRLTSQTKVKKLSSKPVRRKKTLSSIQIALNNQQRRVTIRERSLCRIAREVLVLEKVSHAEIGIRIVTDRTMATLNRRWLGHDGATDVVTFPLGRISPHRQCSSEKHISGSDRSQFLSTGRKTGCTSRRHRCQR